MIEQDRQIADVIARERPRLRSFIRRRVPNDADAEDLLQDVFFELVEAYRLLAPIDFVTGWLYRVARNRITDLFRKKRPEAFSDAMEEDGDGELLDIGACCPRRRPDQKRSTFATCSWMNSMWRSLNCRSNNGRLFWHMRWKAAASKSLRQRAV
jgi:RNA polymerase sigma factor (sigma-70 family)